MKTDAHLTNAMTALVDAGSRVLTIMEDEGIHELPDYPRALPSLDDIVAGLAGTLAALRHPEDRARTRMILDGTEFVAWPERGAWYEVGKADQIGALYMPMLVDGTADVDALGEIEVRYEDA